MKKLIVPIIVCFFAFSMANAIVPNELAKKNNVELSTSYFKVNAFCKLIQIGNYEAVKSLIDAGEDVNAKSNGLTPLMFAARHNRAKIAKLLIKNGAKLNTKSDRSRLTAMDLAKRSKAVDAIKVLEDALSKS
ncbi:MAG: ankyrin repeat domain-containing protein [Flavobacteriaceae bacterium]|nr:MAG: ankyrin repeat domain-containing protein [Flavobacteriaceae bacterium]